VILESIEPHNYGPFAFPVTLQLEPDVTVLTGPNDTGKSSLLKLIARISSMNVPNGPTEEEFNLDSLHDKPVTWNERDDFGATATFRVTDAVAAGLQHLHSSDLTITVQFNIAPSRPFRRIVRYVVDKKPVKGTWDLPPTALLRAVLLPPPTEMRSVIELNKPTELERELLQIAFGREFRFELLQGMAEAIYLRQLTAAKRNLNQIARRVLPPSLGLEWDLTADLGRREKLALFLQDAHGGLTPFGSRGAGVRKVMTFLARLMAHDFRSGYTCVLYDEPELSLHADSQHIVRSLLEELGRRPNVQVVYATHSPSMINVMRPHALRLFSRESRDGRATICSPCATVRRAQPAGAKRRATSGTAVGLILVSLSEGQEPCPNSGARGEFKPE
jgi:ABC-type Mn2+/Zn2+ transport system ATPase subunit